MLAVLGTLVLLGIAVSVGGFLLQLAFVAVVGICAGIASLFQRR